MSWDKFESVANLVMYDAGFGETVINPNLKIVGVDNWWLERAEYDGSEWWDYKEFPDGSATDFVPEDLFRTFIYGGSYVQDE